MDIYCFWTARAMIKLARAKELGRLSSSGINKSRTALAERKKSISQELH
jgi:hypothetical protein